MKNELSVRKAVPEDIDGIFQLLELYVSAGIVLQRSKEDIAHYLGNFRVAVLPNDIFCDVITDKWKFTELEKDKVYKKEKEQVFALGIVGYFVLTKNAAVLDVGITTP